MLSNYYSYGSPDNLQIKGSSLMIDNCCCYCSLLLLMILAVREVQVLRTLLRSSLRKSSRSQLTYAQVSAKLGLIYHVALVKITANILSTFIVYNCTDQCQTWVPLVLIGDVFPDEIIELQPGTSTGFCQGRAVNVYQSSISVGQSLTIKCTPHPKPDLSRAISQYLLDA